MNMSYILKLHTVVSVIALSMTTAATAQSPRTPKAGARDVSLRRGTEMATGSGFTLEVATISKGGGVLADGSILVIGQPFVGTMSNDEFTIEVGIVPSLAPTTEAIVTPDPLEAGPNPFGSL